MCDTCGCKKAESFEAEMPNIVIPHGVDITSKIEKLSQRLGKHRIMSQDLRDKQFEAESFGAEMTVDEMNEMVKNLGNVAYNEFCYRFDIDPEDAQEMSWFIADHYDSPKVISWLEENHDKFDAEEFGADFDNAPYESFDEVLADSVSFPEKEYEIDDRDIYNPDRAAMDMIRGNRALREEMEEQGVYVGRHPGYYDDNGRWVELMEHYDDYERIPNWLQGLVGVGLVGGLTYLLTKISGSTTDAGNNTTEPTE
tara:strand:- start:12810 stop:13571 length:762 start_codon:yes stop_codon:yes gene_type:complete